MNIYISSFDGNVYAVSVDDGTEHWRFVTGAPIESSPTVADGLVFIGSGDKNLYAIDAKDGTERWRLTTEDRVSSSAAVVNGIVYFGSYDGYLYAASTEAGERLWSFEVGNAIFSSPVVVGGKVFVGSVVHPDRDLSDLIIGLYAIGARIPKLSVGGTASVTETASLRGGPASTAVERAELKADTMIAITGESVTGSNSVIWWPVKVDETGAQGWVEASKLEPVTSGPEPTATP